MALFQRDSDGLMKRRPAEPGENSTLARSEEGDDPCDDCGCGPEVSWYSLWPCSEPFPVDPDECYPGSTADAGCLWIGEVNLGNVWAAAELAGDYDPLADPSTWPDYFVVTYNGYCYLVVGPGIGTAGPCAWRCTTTAPADAPPGTEALHVDYLGTDCDHAACDHDNDNEPDPPVDPPETGNPDPVVDICGCPGKTGGTVTFAGIATCDCADTGATYRKASGNFNGTWDLDAACDMEAIIPYIQRAWTDTPAACDGVPASVTAQTMLASATGGPPWTVGIGSIASAAGAAFDNAAAAGDCDGAVIANGCNCGDGGCIAGGGTCVITLA